jgi:NADH dehydrogenase (ubiquinone) 1 alpha subcomplex subunit 8
MVFSDKDYLPSPKELDVQELNVSAPVLRAAAHQMGKYCDTESKEFMLCRREEKDPRKCMQEGKAVTNCGVSFLMKMKEHCMKEFTEYWQCIDYRGKGTFALTPCRKIQVPYDSCVLEHLGQERVHFGYFGKIRTHESNRPKPRELPIKHAPIADAFPTEFSCEDLQLVKEQLEGDKEQTWQDKLKPMLEDLTKDFPKEKQRMWYNFPERKQTTGADGRDWGTYGDGGKRVNTHDQSTYDKLPIKPAREYTSDQGHK